MKKLLLTASLVVASVSLAGCESNGLLPGGSVSCPTTVEGVLSFLEATNANCFVDGLMFGEEFASEIDGSKMKSTTKTNGVETVEFTETKNGKVTTYTQVGDEWTSTTEDEGDDNPFGLPELTASDFTEDEDGNWVYSEDVIGSWMGDYTMDITISFDDGEFTLKFDMEFDVEGTPTTAEYMSMRFYDFGKAKVTLPTVASTDAE